MSNGQRYLVTVQGGKRMVETAVFLIALIMFASGLGGAVITGTHWNKLTRLGRVVFISTSLWCLIIGTLVML